MTREKAIEHGKKQLEIFGGEHREFIELAIKALEQEPCDKCVYSTKDGYCQYDDIAETIPPFEHCEDAVSRDDALKALAYDIKSFEFKSGVEKHMNEIANLLNTIYEIQSDNVKALPSVNPQEPKTGHWIKISPADIFECSECGQNVMTSDICAYRYCHGCGVKMAESELQDDK